MASIKTTFFIKELLEAILIHVDMQTLLVSCQRVCRFWHMMIKTSPSLQRALFFLPEAPSASPRRMNRLLMERFPHWFQGPDEPQDHFLFRRKNGYLQFASLQLYAAGVRPEENPYLRSDASWKTMLTAQPPITVLGILDYSFHEIRFEIRSRILRFTCPEHPSLASPAGMRMGDLYDLVLHHCATWEVSGFTIMQRIDEVSKECFVRHAARPETLAKDLGKLRDDGVQVLIQLFLSSGGFIDLVPEIKYAFWDRCGMTRHPEKIIMGVDVPFRILDD